MGPLVFRQLGNEGLGRLGLGGRGTRVGGKGGGDGGRGSMECRVRGEVSFIATKGVARFVGVESGNKALSSTVESYVLGDTPGAFFRREPWSEGAKVHGTWVRTRGRGLDGGNRYLGGRCTGGWVSFSFRFSCTNAVVEALEVGGEFPVGLWDLVGEGKCIFDLIAQASRESGLLCGIVPLGVGHMA